MSDHPRIVENPATRDWNEFVRTHGGHVLQSTAWGDLKSRFGWSALRLALAHGEEYTAGALVLFRTLAPGLVFAYVPRGPVANPIDRDSLGALLDAAAAAARARGAFALKVELNWPTPAPLPEGELVSICRTPLRPANPIQPRTTIHVDLTRELDTILAQMKPKWRYNIRLAERKGVAVHPGTLDDIPAFYRLLVQTGKRDRFAIHSLDYYRVAFELFTACDSARLFVAEFAGEPLAAIFVTAFGEESIYLYGASSNEHREVMPNHALHWQAMQWAKARGCARYDLWGIADTAWAEAPEQNDDKLPHGLYQFKQGFGGSVVRYAGAYEMVFSRPRYALYSRALALRRGAAGLT